MLDCSTAPPHRKRSRKKLAAARAEVFVALTVDDELDDTKLVDAASADTLMTDSMDVADPMEAIVPLPEVVFEGLLVSVPSEAGVRPLLDPDEY